ncbi:MAG: trigger factor [Flavobacteriaceae bacterium]|jgi:trigger factor|nr:trigger factor [Flavobacteriaceae bacterium]
MNVTQNKIDDLNTVISIKLTPEDYKPKVEKTLKDYRKKANMPGFRKGMTPMSVVKKQYETAVTFEEINKILNTELNNFIAENKLAVLGQPLPKTDNNLDVNANEMTFEFESGLAPEFSVDLSKASIPYYKIEAADKDVNETIERMQSQSGEAVPSDEIVEGGHFAAKVQEVNEDETLVEGGIETTVTFLVEDLKEKNEFLKKKENDVVYVYAQALFKDVHKLQHFLGLSHEEAHHFNEKLKITIGETSTKTKAELNQDFFDKIYGKDKIHSEEELKAKIKEEFGNYYKRESDTRFINDSVEWLFENIKFDLPSEFLTKYIQSTAKEPMTDEQAAEEYKKSEKAMRYQLIEGKILSDNKVNIQFQDLLDYTKTSMKQQFAMYGYAEVPEEEIEKYSVNALKNEEHVRKTSGDIIQRELFKIFDAQIKKEEKTVTIEDFDKILKEEHNHSH